MIYLARKDGDEDGHLSWELDLNQHNVAVKSVELYVTSECYYSGSVIWRLASNNNKVLQPTPGKSFLNTNHEQCNFSFLICRCHNEKR